MAVSGHHGLSESIGGGGVEETDCGGGGGVMAPCWMCFGLKWKL